MFPPRLSVLTVFNSPASVDIRLGGHQIDKGGERRSIDCEGHSGLAHVGQVNGEAQTVGGAPPLTNHR